MLHPSRRSNQGGCGSPAEPWEKIAQWLSQRTGYIACDGGDLDTIWWKETFMFYFKDFGYMNYKNFGALWEME